MSESPSHRVATWPWLAFEAKAMVKRGMGGKFQGMAGPDQTEKSCELETAVSLRWNCMDTGMSKHSNKGLEQIVKYTFFFLTKTSPNKYANIFERLKTSRTNTQIYLRHKFERIFEYILGLKWKTWKIGTWKLTFWGEMEWNRKNIFANIFWSKDKYSNIFKDQ